MLKGISDNLREADPSRSTPMYQMVDKVLVLVQLHHQLRSIFIGMIEELEHLDQTNFAPRNQQIQVKFGRMTNSPWVFEVGWFANFMWL